MNVTRAIGTSTDLGINSHTGTLNDEIAHDLGEYAPEHDVDALEQDYREAIADVLPEGISLHGDTPVQRPGRRPGAGRHPRHARHHPRA